MEENMELERLKQAFNIKEQPNEEISSQITLDPNDPRLVAARKVVDREQASIAPMLIKIKDYIDAGKKGIAWGEIEEAEKIIQTHNTPKWEQTLLNQYKDMLK